MSALAELLLGLGYRVSGSDRFLDQHRELDVLRKLEGMGATLIPQDGSGVASPHTRLVISTAIEPGNPELAAAARCGARVTHRAELLAELAQGKRVLAVAGTAGKTTVTGMLGYVLAELGADPTVVNGGVVLNWASPAALGNVRLGGSELWVIEVDESDRSLLRFQPDVSLITNISKDHFELTDVIALFRAFAAQTRTTIVAGEGVSAVLSNSTPVAARIVEEPFAAETREGRRGFRFADTHFTIPLIGEHNLRNAFLVAVTCRELGLDAKKIATALASFRGIGRRLEMTGEGRGVTVYDDYAHNPAKIAAAWSAVAERHPRVRAVWRPHGFGPLSIMFEELVDAVKSVSRHADELYVLPVFYAGGTARGQVTSEEFVERLRAGGVSAALTPDYDTLSAHLRTSARQGDAVLVMGARDPELSLFARRLAAQLRGS